MFSAIKEEILPIDEVACYILKYMFINYKENLKDIINISLGEIF